MGRPRIELPHDIEQQIVARTARGESAKTIREVLGGVASLKTIERRQNEVRGKASPAPSKPLLAPPAPSPVLPLPDAADVPDEIPETAPLEDLNRWMKRLDKAMSTAESEKNLGAMASIAAKVATLMGLRHKFTPLPKSDPNEAPDMKALAAKGRAMLEKLADELFPSL